LVLLAHYREEGATSEFIAESASTNPARVRRVLARLVRAGVLFSREGGGGGYILARAPADITLDEVFTVLDQGPVLPLQPRAPNVTCPVGAGIVPALRELEGEAGRAIRKALARHSLDWLARRVATRAATPE
jgi:DNA-binding IscR family transcriptional regulator